MSSRFLDHIIVNLWKICTLRSSKICQTQKESFKSEFEHISKIIERVIDKLKSKELKRMEKRGDDEANVSIAE